MDTKYLKNVALYLISALISVLIICYILYHLFGGFEIETETLLSELVTRSEKISMTAYVFREEELLYSETSGAVNYRFDNGDRVASGAAVADVYASGTVEIRNEMMEIDRMIEIWEQSSPGETRTTMDKSLLDRQITQLYHIIRSHMADDDLSYVLQKKNDLLVLLNKRGTIVGDTFDYAAQIEALEEKKKTLTERLDAVSETVVTEKSGYFYSNVDGYESIFSSSQVGELTLDSFEKLKNTPPDETGRGDGIAIGKLVTDYVWYIVCEIGEEQIRYFETGAVYPVMFPYSSDTTVNMSLERIVTQGDKDKALLVFKTGRIPDNFNYLRMQTVEIVRENYTGFRVPVSAVRIIDGKQGVYTLSGNVVSFREIEPLFEEDGFFIVAETASDGTTAGMLRLNDLIIVKGKNLYDGKIIG